MVNQQKVVQQETAVVVNDHIYVSPSLYHFDPKGVIETRKNDIGRDGDTFTTTALYFLLHYFLLIYHPYPPSFHEMIFTLVQMSMVSERVIWLAFSTNG